MRKVIRGIGRQLGHRVLRQQYSRKQDLDRGYDIVSRALLRRFNRLDGYYTCSQILRRAITIQQELEVRR